MTSRDFDSSKFGNEAEVMAKINAWAAGKNMACPSCGGTQRAVPKGNPVLLLPVTGKDGKEGFGMPVVPFSCEGCGTVRFVDAGAIGFVPPNQ
jgi:hypothetical protein